MCLTSWGAQVRCVRLSLQRKQYIQKSLIFLKSAVECREYFNIGICIDIGDDGCFYDLRFTIPITLFFWSYKTKRHLQLFLNIRKNEKNIMKSTGCLSSV